MALLLTLEGLAYKAIWISARWSELEKVQDQSELTGEEAAWRQANSIFIQDWAANVRRGGHPSKVV